VYVAPVGVLRGYIIDSPYSAYTALKRSVSLASVEAPHLLSAYRKPVYLYFTSLDGLASSVSTSAVRRYAAGEYVDAYSQYTASNRTFKFEAIERLADWFFRVSPVRRFYEYLQPLDWLTLVKAIGATVGVYENATSEYRALLASKAYNTYERLYDKLVYSKSVSPLLTSYLFAYRPRRRYASYTVSHYSQLYSLLNYIKAVLFSVADLEDVYGVPLYKKLSYSFSSAEDVLVAALGAKPIYVLLTDAESVFDSSAYKLVSIAHSDYEDLYTLVLGVKPVSSYHSDVESAVDSALYRLASKAYNTYERLYDKLVYSKTVSPLLTFQILTYRPRRRYSSYATSDYSNVYNLMGYVKTASPLLLLQISVYRPRRRYVSYTMSDYSNTYDGTKYVKAVVLSVSGLENVYSIPSHIKSSYVFDVISDVLTAVLGVKPVYIRISALESDADSFMYRLASRAYADYEGLYASVVFSKSVSNVLLTQLAYRPRRRYLSYSASDYPTVYSLHKYVKAVVLRVQSLEDLYGASSYRLASFKFTEYISPINRFSYSKSIAVSSYSAVYSSADYVKSISPILAVRSAAYRPMYMVESFSVSEFYLPYESSAVKTPPVYSVDSYEKLYEPVYAPTVRYYNVYFVNTYRYSNIYDLERLYESFRYEKKSAGFSFTSYEGLYEGFIAQRG